MAGEFTTSDYFRTETLATPEHFQPLLPAMFCLRSVVASKVSVTVLAICPSCGPSAGGRAGDRVSSALGTFHGTFRSGKVPKSDHS